VTVHGKKAVVMGNAERFEIRVRSQAPPTLVGSVERSRKYQGAAEGVEFERSRKTGFRDKRREIFDAAFLDDTT
jgi:hypothetical protein